MKKTKWRMVVLLALLAMVVSVHAQDAALPEQLLNTNVRDWQLNGLTLLILIQLAGRAYAGLSKGGGLVGVGKGILFGTNTPKE